MQKFLLTLLAVPVAILPPMGGCGRSDEPTVILPGEPYQLSVQETSNRERAKKTLSEQRQQ